MHVHHEQSSESGVNSRDSEQFSVIRQVWLSKLNNGMIRSSSMMAMVKLFQNLWSQMSQENIERPSLVRYVALNELFVYMNFFYCLLVYLTYNSYYNYHYSFISLIIIILQFFFKLKLRIKLMFSFTPQVAHDSFIKSTLDQLYTAEYDRSLCQPVF